jgi:hypothetical protein
VPYFDRTRFASNNDIPLFHAFSMNSGTPSDFDLHPIIDDYPSSSEDFRDDNITSASGENTFSDELDGIREVAQERANRLTKERVVIQHRQWGGAPIFRSSSLPPGEYLVSSLVSLAWANTSKYLQRPLRVLG